MPRPAFVVLATSLVMCGCQSRAPTDAPPVNASEVTPPAPSVPVDLASYSGIWKGAWDDYGRTTLVVKAVTPPTASVIYEWGAAPDWHVYTPGSETATAHFVGEKLVVKFKTGTVLTYTLEQNGRLDAQFVNDSRHQRASAVLTKQ